MNLAAFDLEIARPVVNDNWHGLGISCAVCVLSDDPNAIVWQGQPELNEYGIWSVVETLNAIDAGGYQLVAFNGAGFDFRMLADGYPSQRPVAAHLARFHWDIFFHLFCTLGYAPGLNALSRGAGLGGKTEGMDGGKAPVLWQQGRYQEVIDYCIQDTKLTLQLAQTVLERGAAEWISKSGKSNRVEVPRWLAVAEAVQLPEPDTSWMTDPWPRSKFVEWCGL